MAVSTIDQAVSNYINIISTTRSSNTARTYANALRLYLFVLDNHHLPTESTPPAQLPEESIIWFTQYLKNYAPSTERLYITSAYGFFEYLIAEQIATPNLARVRLLIRQRTRKPGQRLPQYHGNEIAIILDYIDDIANNIAINPLDHLINLRDRAFIVTLAETGLRVHEACSLRRGDIDWNEARAVILGKGNREAVVRFSNRALSVLKQYISARASIDGASGKPLSSLPLFIRHDRGAGKKVLPITTTTGRNIVNQRVNEALGPEAVGKITPHSFRHYFVTVILKSSGNLKLAQELARHRNIAVTQRYAHLSDDELDQGYARIFDEI